MPGNNFSRFFLFLAACASLFGPAHALFAKDLEHVSKETVIISTDISTTIDATWKAMIDFDAYREWNTWYRLEGDARVGARIKIFSGDQHLDLKITKMDENTVCWVDVSWFTYFGMGGWRCRKVEINPNGKGVQFTNHFEYTGPFRSYLESRTKETLIEGMKRENKNLKDFLEKQGAL